MSSPEAKAKARAAIAATLARTAVRDAVVQRAATAHMLARARKAARAGPRGMGGSRTLYAKNTNGSFSVDPMSLDRIPVRRVVRVGKHAFNSKSVRSLLEHNPSATNPLTRQPFPDDVYRRYGKHRKQRLYKPHEIEDQLVVWGATMDIVDAFYDTNARRFSDIPADKKQYIESFLRGVEIDFFEEPGVSYVNVTLREFVTVAEHYAGRAREEGMPAQLFDGDGRLLRHETLMPPELRRRMRQSARMSTGGRAPRRR